MIYFLNGCIVNISCVLVYFLYKCMFLIKIGLIGILLLYICVNLYDYVRVFGIIFLYRIFFLEGLI